MSGTNKPLALEIKIPVVMISGDATPPVFCAKLMEMSEDIEGIACVVKLKDGKTKVFNTNMTSGDMAWFRWVFDQDFRPED